MQVSEILRRNDVTLSFEVFPPKVTSNFEAVQRAAYDVAKLQPSYMSVTYGAGGSTRGNTLKIARGIQQEHGVTTITHLTCVGATKEGIRQALADMKEAGIENVLALRGDRPKDFEGEPFTDYRYASELVEDIRAFGGMCIGGACYPEGHVESENTQEDIRNLKKKVDAGCEY
ncbi:MAG: methylenetetrahydrofolate reductase, partial [Lachnospiraceae bacterium]|nr:methylenetetrahydrofolate reductase [Lachnospiraceae bacterium]